MERKPWIKAIDTEYNGMLFRSRLEARWAVFFDAAKIKYEYEPEGFEYHGYRYLPDFYLPETDTYAEVKPDREGIEKDIIKASKLIYWGGPIKRLVLLGNIPGPCRDGGLWHFPCMYYSTELDYILAKPVVGWAYFSDNSLDKTGKCELDIGNVWGEDFTPPFCIGADNRVYSIGWQTNPQNPLKKPCIFTPMTDCQLGGKHTYNCLNSGYTMDQIIDFQQNTLNPHTFSAYKAARCARFEFKHKK